MLDVIEKENPEIKENTKAILLHIIDELDRNVRNHSQLDESSNMSYSAAYFKKTNRMNFTIYDEGVGFEEAMINRCLENGDELIEKCLEKKVTAYSNHEFCLDEGSKNSGYGLFILSEIVKRCDGILYISSHESECFKDEMSDTNIKFSINKNIENYKLLRGHLAPHTLVYFDLDVSKIVSDEVQNFLSQEISGGSSVSSKSKQYFFYPKASER